jgi:hypothetical protein
VAEDAIFFETPAKRRAWLEEHHATGSELWLGIYKKLSGRRSLTWSEIVDEALCFGWIDGKAQRLDELRYRQRLTPRRPNSNWSAVDVAKVAALRDQGRMAPAGEAAFAARRADRPGVYVRAATRCGLRRGPGSGVRQERGRVGVVRGTGAVVSHHGDVLGRQTKHPETRARRLATLIECSAERRRVPPLAG